MQTIDTPHLADSRLLDLPGYRDLARLFGEGYDPNLRIDSLASCVTRHDLLLGASLAIEHECIDRVSSRDMQKVVAPGALTLVRGDYGSLSIRCVDQPSPPGVSSTVLQDTLVYPLKGGPLSGWLLSLDRGQQLDEFTPDAIVQRSSDLVLSDSREGYLLARTGYDALSLKTESPTVIAEFRLHRESSYSWVIHEGSRRPLRLILQEVSLTHEEMTLLFLAHAPKDADYAEVIQPYTDSPCHFVRWAAYSYLLQKGTYRNHALAQLQRDPHPQLRSVAKRLNGVHADSSMHA